jgi:pimeloyl-ACP methyl ester carboxylesterase
MSTDTVCRRARRNGPINDLEPGGQAGSSPRSVESPSRAFGPASAIALAAITVLVLGLVYLRFAPGAGPVSVPPGAKAGDLALKPCSYTTEQGSAAADCGTLVVPENRANPASRLIALPVTRLKARSASPGEPIFYLEGGPGLSNMRFKQAGRFAEDRDVVLVGYRGIDGSIRLDCPEVPAALKHSTDVLGEPTFRAYAAAYRACADRLTKEGVDLTVYGLPQQVEDLEAARIALGYERIDLLSQSAGTRTAMIYAWRFPERIHRSVMIAVNPPGHFLFDAQTTDEQIGRYAELCAQDARCRQRTDDLAASMRRTAAAMPDRWLFLPIKASNVRLSTLFGLWETNALAGMTLDAWLAAAEGDASGFWLQSFFGDLVPGLFVYGQYAAAATIDAPAAREYFSRGGQDRTSLGWAGSSYAWGGGGMADAWPAAPGADTYRQVPPSDVETLLIGGTLDSATPPQVATRELLPYLPNGHQVVLSAFGHVSSFFQEQPQAGTRLINTFLASGQVDDSLYQPQTVDFTPGMTLAGVAKLVAGTMIGLALLTVLSLVWMAHRVHQRGGFGRTTSVLLRALSPIVLGLGGWFLGALIAMTMLPGVRLDDPWLVVLSVGVPTGLGIYWAWVHRDWSAKTRTTGFAAAAGGALAGAWLGVNVREGLVAPMTAIVGAAVGANLALLTLDIWWDRHARDRFVDTTAQATLEALPTPN